MLMKIFTKNLIVVGLLIGFAVISIHSATGPAGTYAANVTGASFDAGTCTNCHGSGSNYNATLSLQLYSGSTQVTSYIPGNSYTLRLTRSASLLTATNGGFGFQTTCATSVTNVNINNWGTLPVNTTNVLLNGRNYVEHTTKLSKLTTQVNIPWTAPTLGTGAVKFYTALNTVNGNGNSSGDQVVSTSLTITESTLPITWLYFIGNHHQGNVELEWATANETNNAFFTIEKSSDGNSYSSLADRIPSNGNLATYSFVDKAPYDGQTFYRIMQTDVDGSTHYYKTIQVKTTSPEFHNYHYQQGSVLVINANSDQEATANVSLTSMNGTVIEMKTVQLNKGSNQLRLEMPQQLQLYIIKLENNGRILYLSKLLPI